MIVWEAGGSLQLRLKAAYECECNAPASQYGTYGALHSNSYAAFTRSRKLPPASHLLLKVILSCTAGATSSCYCKARQKPFTTLLLNQVSSAYTVQSVDRLPMRAIATVGCYCCAGSRQATQCPPTSACQPGLEAFLTQAKQQMPSLAGRLTAPQLQDFLCSMVGPHQLAVPSSSSSASSIQVNLCMRPLSAQFVMLALPLRMPNGMPTAYS